MWEKFRDPNHPNSPKHPEVKARPKIRRTPPDERAAGTEGLCHAIYDGTLTSVSRAPCALAAHHTGRHDWDPRPPRP